MAKLTDITGRTFGRLTVIERAPNSGKRTMWKCQCSCGTVVFKDGGKLISGHTKSCGCLRREPRETIDRSGKRFGRLVVIEKNSKKAGGQIFWLCQCDCGKQVVVSASGLISGNTKSCGCLNIESIIRRNTKHGRAYTPEYRVWRSMIDRCTNPNKKGFHRYGGRGIIVHERYRNSFTNFFADLGPRPDPKFTLERLDNEKGYAPGNLAWVSRKTNERNRRDNHFLSFRGERKTIAEWSEITGLSSSTLLSRIRSGWAVESALLEPLYFKYRRTFSK